MEMTLNEYLAHYFGLKQFVLFLLVTIILLFAVYAVLYARAKHTCGGRPRRLKKEFTNLTERFYELIFSGTCIIGFMAIYYLINRFATGEPFRTIWDSYKDFWLLIMMVIAILMNTLLDHVILKLKHLTREEIASVRLVGMVYMFIIFFYVKFIYENDNYDMFITYFLTLMVGRFVYFDASFKDFIDNAKRAALSLPLMLIALVYIALLAAYGFGTEYLLKHNGVITNTFFAHLFICVAILIFHKLPYKMFKLLKDDGDDRRFGKRAKQKATEDDDILIDITDLD